MSRITSSARHRASVDGNLALQGLAFSAKSHAKNVGRPVAVVAITSGLAFSAMGTATASSYTDAASTQGATTVAAPAASGATHTVVAGDTLGGISAIHGVSLPAVLAANGLSLSSVIYPGDTLVLPVAGAQAPIAAPVAAPVQTVSAPAVAAAPVQVQQAASVAPAAAYAAPASGVYLANASIAPLAAPAPAAPASAAMQAPAASGVAATLVASAQSQIGSIQDCTVLVERALRAAGISVGDLGPSQFFQFGSVVGSPAPGDLVITGGHVAIYVGGGQVISSGMNGVNATMQHPLSDLPGASFVRVG